MVHVCRHFFFDDIPSFVHRAYVNIIDLTMNSSDEEKEEEVPTTNVLLASTSHRMYVDYLF